MCLSNVEYKPIKVGYKLLDSVLRRRESGFIEGVYQSPFYWENTCIVLARYGSKVGLDYTGGYYLLYSSKGKVYPTGIHAYTEESGHPANFHSGVMLVLENPYPGMQLPTDGHQVAAPSWVINKVIYSNNEGQKEVPYIGLFKGMTYKHPSVALEDFWVIGNSRREIISRTKVVMRDRDIVSGALTVACMRASMHEELIEEYMLIKREKTVRVSKIGW